MVGPSPMALAANWALVAVRAVAMAVPIAVTDARTGAVAVGWC